jgi:CheY-like chemotaxis protein
MLGVRPNDGAARALLAQHLRELRDESAELDFVHLESALGAALSRMERDAFSPASLVSVRVLACRYESLASMPSRSGTHPVVSEEDAEPSLQGKQVLVADDDTEVRWFYVGILREAGARVTEARDGVEALELARTEPPDVILADIVMPRLDGLELCAAVRREPGLDGVPVVLLSWRDDFLHRTRELRAGAQGYLRKELPARQILSRISSVLEPLTELERALGFGGESRGDLEDIGVSRLLRTTRRFRPDASIVLQDPWSLFEIEMRDGHLVRLTRTAIDGAFNRGAEALPSLVGMSSGRFVIVKRVPGADPQELDVLDDAFADATLHLAKMMNALADDPDCRVSFDEDVLGAYVRHSPIGVQRLIARLVEGEPPRALWQSGAGTRSLVDALLTALARQGAIREVVQPEPLFDEQPAETEAPSGGRLNGPQIRQDSAPVADPIERENFRAQSALAMFRQPANRGSRSAHPIWRLSAAGPGAETLSRFETELRRKPRLLGFAFIVLLLATTGLLIWREVSPPPAAAPPPVAAPAPIEVEQAEAVAVEEQGVDARPPPSEEPWSRFAGTLNEGVDASLGLSEGQGVLQIDGTSGVRIEVDGIDRGSLPAVIVLDEGRHTVRFETDARSTTRFYYVKAGATRVLRAVTRPGGFVDPR